MARENLNDLTAFVIVAREQSFTRAAAQLGISQSALSHAIKSLESRLGVRLLTRSTRSVVPTQIGERLLETLAPKIDEIYTELDRLGEYRDTPAGTIRLSTTDFAINVVLWPKLKPFLQKYPDIKVELIDDYTLTDIVAHRFDAGTRLGEQLQNGMISVPIGPPLRFAVVASPEYFEKVGKPKTPHDLEQHNCINMRFMTQGNLYAWEFEKDGKEINVRVDGQLVFNRTYQVLDAAHDGMGIGYVPRDIAENYIQDGSLVSVLEDWLPLWPGYYLYYPSRRQHTQAFKLLIEALRYRS